MTGDVEVTVHAVRTLLIVLVPAVALVLWYLHAELRERRVRVGRRRLPQTAAASTPPVSPRCQPVRLPRQQCSR